MSFPGKCDLLQASEFVAPLHIQAVLVLSTLSPKAASSPSSSSFARHCHATSLGTTACRVASSSVPVAAGVGDLEFKSDHKPSPLKCSSGSPSPPECMQVPWVGRSSLRSAYMASGSFPKPLPRPFPCLYKCFSELSTCHPTPCSCLCLCGCSIHSSNLSPDSPSSEEPSLIPSFLCLLLLPQQDWALLGTGTDVSQPLSQLHGPAQA